MGPRDLPITMAHTMAQKHEVLRRKNVPCCMLDMSHTMPLPWNLIGHAMPLPWNLNVHAMTLGRIWKEFVMELSFYTPSQIVPQRGSVHVIIHRVIHGVYH